MERATREKTWVASEERRRDMYGRFFYVASAAAALFALGLAAYLRLGSRRRWGMSSSGGLYYIYQSGVVFDGIVNALLLGCGFAVLSLVFRWRWRTLFLLMAHLGGVVINIAASMATLD